MGQPPLATDNFRDRELQYREVGRLLADPSTRIVTVVGRAGMGKTSLAAKVLRDLEQNRWPHIEDCIPVDGIVYQSTRTDGISVERLFLDCAEMLGGARGEELARTWASPHLSTSQKIDRLLQTLSGGLFLLLLDNVEDLLNESGKFNDENLQAFVEHSLRSEHGLRLLVTSRVPLAFPPQAMRHDLRVPLTEGLPVSDGVAILREQDPNDECGLRGAPAEQLTRAVERLHAVPRALQVLAGMLSGARWTRLDVLLERFYEHEVALEDLVREAYRGLDPGALRVLQALAVFRRPVKLVAVDFLLRPFAPGLDVPAAAQRLARANLIRVDRETGRTWLHPIDQDYAYSDIPAAGDYTRQLLERRAAEYYRQLRSSSASWRSIIDKRLAPLREFEPHLREFEHRIRALDYEEAAKVLGEIDVDRLIWKGHAARAQAMRSELEGKITNSRLLMEHAFSLAQIAMVLGPMERSRDQLRVVVELSRELGDRTMERRALTDLGATFRRLGDLDSAVGYCEQALALGDLDDDMGERMAVGMVYAYHGDLEQALRLAESMAHHAEELRNPLIEGWAHNLHALINLILGRCELALAHARAAQELYTKSEESDPSGYMLNVAGLSLFGLRRLDEAADELQRAVMAARDSDNPRLEGISLVNVAYLQYLRNELEQAFASATAGATVLERIGAAERTPARHLQEAIRAARAGDRASEARSLLESALSARHLPDLHRPIEVVQSAQRAAEAGGLPNLGTQAQALESALRSRLVLRCGEDRVPELL